MVNDVVIGSALRNTVDSINRSQNALDRTTSRLATGRAVNSALDQPQNFFAASALTNRANDFSRLLDGIGQSIRTIEETIIGVQAIEALLNQAEAIAIRTQDIIRTGGTDPAVITRTTDVSAPPLSTQILDAGPDAYFRLNETSGTIQDIGALGPVAANYDGGATPNAAPLYTNDPQPSVDFNGIDGRIQVADANHINLQDTTARTVELVFNADTVAGRQVLYEEGALVNGLSIYIDNGDIHVTAEDDGQYTDIDISAPIVAGQTYHVAFVYSASNNSFTGYLDGIEIGSAGTAGQSSFPDHVGDIGIGGINESVQFHDGEASGDNGFNFDGRISDVAIYNRALGQTELLSHANSLNSTVVIEFPNEDFTNAVNQINQIVSDANYRGINLLGGDDLITDFNEKRSTKLVTESVDFTFEGLGIEDHDFTSVENIDTIIKSVRDALKEVREYGQSITNDLAIIATRQDYTRDLISNHLAGADDLTLADLNEEGANLLASQTRLDIGQESLGLAAQSQATILDIITGNA